MIKYTAFFTFLLMFVLNLCAYAKTEVPNPTDRFFINDYANVIDAETENYIFEKGKAYNGNGGPQVVVLTLNDIGLSSVEDFSIETARKWGIGSKDADNGVLILLVTDSRDIRIEVGYGLEGILNDGKCGRFIRNAAPMLSSGDYSGGIKQIYNDIIGELEEPTPDEEEEDGMAGIIAPIILLLLIIFISSIGRHNRPHGGHRGGRFTGGGFYGGYGGGFGNGGFGGFGGGGGFSGGGGGFGGGGASGKF
ncbi:MAG: TPM domain-containing protein [Clostridia bacterium]|nr:TPM domain-containing protein [Clostridia bacterium]MCI8979521.1 TPM domain-containing protein [Clostridia bacterium]